MSELLGGLRAVVGASHVVVDADVRAGYEVDWTGRRRGEACCVVRPGSVDEVAAVVRCCAEHGAAVVTQGGNSGLVGGGVPRRGEVVVSTRRLDRLDPVDLAASQVTCGAGATIEAVQRHARGAGLDLAVDWGARQVATVGGGIATNAGGSRVVRFGTMRSQVMGIEAVLADGTVVTDLGGLPKSTMGVHLPSLLCGSEGTLAVITAARLRLVPCFQHRAAAWLTVPSVQAAVDLLATARSTPSLDAIEVLLPEAVAVVADQFGFAPPVGNDGVAVLIECAADRDPAEEMAELLAAVDGLIDGVIAVGAQLEQLTAIRDHVSLAINRLGAPLKLDVAVPLEHLDALVVESRAAVHELAAAARLFAFGHLAEGNLHLNVIGATTDEASAITDRVLGWTVAHGGTVSAEHGVGVAKTGWVERARGTAATAMIRAVKGALDPHNLLNPGVLLPAE